MKESRLFTTIPAILLGIVLSVCSTAAFAVDFNGVFELEGNAVQDAPPLPDDWETLYKGGGATTTFTFIDDMNGEDDIFTKGKSKTPEDPEVWRMKYDPPPPDKDNITNAYAANYMVWDPIEHVTEQVVYFGADLYAENGDAELAFWFFQSAVGPDGLGGFFGHHMDEDVYVAVKFSNGGKNATITVYEWWAACNKAVKNPGAGDCAADNIRVVIAAAEALCSGIGGTACAITNPGVADSPWDYTPKSGTPMFFPETTFFEGGININDAFGANKCFSTFMVTTGASTSFTATAKDFALREFDVCSVDVTKTCLNDDEDDDTPTIITYDIRGCGTNDGAAPIYLTTLTNSIGGAAQYTPTLALDDFGWYFPGKVDAPERDFDPAEDCSNAEFLKQAVDDGTLVNDLATTTLLAGEALVYYFFESGEINAPTDTVMLDAVGTDGADIEHITDTAECPPRAFEASMNVTKQCAADLEILGENLVVRINVVGTVCNAGEVQLTDLVLTDTVALDEFEILTADCRIEEPDCDPVTMLEPPGDPRRTDGLDCIGYTGHYYPSNMPGTNICPFMDQVTATAFTPINTRPTILCVPNTDPEAPAGTLVCTANSLSQTCNLRALDTDTNCSTGPVSVVLP